MKSIKSGVYIDERDGRKYRTVRIGNRTWFAENLMYFPENLSGIYMVNVTTPYTSLTGVYYTYSSALTVIPEGCEMPAREDVDALVKYIESNGIGDPGNSLKSKTGWGQGEHNEDPLGFGAEPLGHYTPHIIKARLKYSKELLARVNDKPSMRKMTLTGGDPAQFWVRLGDTGLVDEDKYPLASYMAIPSEMYNEAVFSRDPGYVSLHCSTCWADVAVPVRPVLIE